MTLLVDTSVWSLALRRDVEVATKEVVALREAIEGSDAVVTTGLVLKSCYKVLIAPMTDRPSLIASARYP
jgi:predicted nucleic acid-binding protein